MSSFLLAGAMSFTAGFLRPDDQRGRAPADTWAWMGSQADMRPWDDGLLWPRSRYLGTEMANGMLSEDAASTGRFGPPLTQESGGQTMKKIIGTTRDATGSPLGPAVVQGFLTSTDQFVRQLQSDAAGYFEFCTEFSGAQHYLVGYKVASPDVFGTTVNTLVGV